MKQVLIITYYWPPTGGGGVQRWLKFAKYLPEFGWKPVIYTPENPDFEIKDDSLLKDVDNVTVVLKQPIWEPFGLYRKLLGKKATQKQGVIEPSGSSLLSRFSLWVRANLMIPDPRKFWIKPSINYLVKYLKKNPVDIIITTGPPHSMHMIGLGIKKKLDIPWIADFRDPWSDWDVLDLLKISNTARRKHKTLEHQVFKHADKVLTVSWRLGKKLELTGEFQNVEVITNGFDEDDFNLDPINPDKFRISHTGLLNEGRNPAMLWRVLEELCSENESFANDVEIYLAGTIGHEVIEDIRNYQIIKNKVVVDGYITHRKVMEVYNQSAVLLLLVNNTSNSSWIIPAKLYEYLFTGKSILGFGKIESDANKVLVSAGQKEFLNYEDSDKIKTRILEYYHDFKDKKGYNMNTAMNYSRRSLTMSLASLMEPMTKRN